MGKRFPINEIAFDRWGAVQMVQNLEGLGFYGGSVRAGVQGYVAAV